MSPPAASPIMVIQVEVVNPNGSSAAPQPAMTTMVNGHGVTRRSAPASRPPSSAPTPKTAQ